MMKSVQNRRTDLPKQLRFQHRWSVNAPKVARSVAFEPLKDESCGKATSNSGLDYIGRLQVTNRMPNGTHQSRVTIPPSPEGTPANARPVCFKWLHHLGPQGPKLGCGLTRPWDGEDLVQPAIPLALHIVRASRPAALPSLGESVLYPRPGFGWVRYNETRKPRYLAHHQQSGPHSMPAIRALSTNTSSVLITSRLIASTAWTGGFTRNLLFDFKTRR
jgi:hypothetical protein